MRGAEKPSKKSESICKIDIFSSSWRMPERKTWRFFAFSSVGRQRQGCEREKKGHPKDGEKKGFQRLNGKFEEVRCCSCIHSRQPVTILDYPLIWSRKFHSNSAARHHQIVWTSSSKKDKNRTECRQRNSSSSSSILRGKNLIEQSSRPARKKRGLAMLKWEIWICADPMFIMAMDP